jgi:nicotinate-nucleotide pyrophosphorylase (carboxylating)
MSAPLTDRPEVQALLAAALAEDIGSGDATTLALVPHDAVATALLLTRRACVVAGADVAAEVFRRVDPRLQVAIRIADGAAAGAGDVLLTVTGPAGSILTAERTALNFMQRLCGIATLTGEFVRRVKPHGTLILDTRKTTPTLRVLEKYAVRCGGGANHRSGLYDRVLIKDNHRALWRTAHPEGDLAAAARAARAAYPGLEIEIEVESEEELRQVLPAKPEWVLLDNMPPAQLRRCVELAGGLCRLEASGGITLETVAAVAATGVDAISVGALTHSAPAIDLSLEMAEDRSDGP